jgi:beta-glucosidase
MTLEEKVGQVIQADIAAITPEDLREYPLGSILAGGSSAPNGDDRASPAEWLALARAFRAVAAERRPGRTPVPPILGIDAVHGHNNVVGATVFPHNIGLGAARDAGLVRRVAEATAEEVAVTGFDWTFAPTLAVPRDDRWGRTYEGYAEDPEIVAAYSGPAIEGLQGGLVGGRPLAPGRIAASAKHFLADGGTAGGRDQGDAAIGEEELVGVHAAGYPPAIEAGALTVMASYSSWNGVKNHANRTLLTDVLKGRMGFEGFVVGDWNGHGQVEGCTDESCPAAFNAGLDMFMAPDGWKGSTPTRSGRPARARSRRPGWTTPCGASCGSRRRSGCSRPSAARWRAASTGWARPSIAAPPARRYASRWCCSRTTAASCRCGRPRACWWPATVPTT